MRRTAILNETISQSKLNFDKLHKDLATHDINEATSNGEESAIENTNNRNLCNNSNILPPPNPTAPETTTEMSGFSFSFGNLNSIKCTSDKAILPHV